MKKKIDKKKIEALARKWVKANAKANRSEMKDFFELFSEDYIDQILNDYIHQLEIAQAKAEGKYETKSFSHRRGCTRDGCPTSEYCDKCGETK